MAISLSLQLTTFEETVKFWPIVDTYSIWPDLGAKGKFVCFEHLELTSGSLSIAFSVVGWPL